MKLLRPLININIINSSCYVPESTIVTNLDLLNAHSSTKRLPLIVKKRLAKSIIKKYGFKNRYMTRKPKALGEQDSKITSEDIALKCLQSCFVKDRDIDFFIHGTTTSSRYTGTQSTSLLGKIEQFSPSLEIKAGCSTSLASLYSGVMSLKSGHDNVMILVTETMSKLLNEDIRDTWFGLSDGAAALWLETTQKEVGYKVLGMTYGTDGKYVDMYTTQGKFPPNQYDLDNGGYILKGDADQLRKLTIEHYKRMFDLFKKNFDMNTITHLIPHQVNLSIIYEMKKYFNIENLNVLTNSEDIGNIGGSSVLYTLSDSIKKDIFKKGDKILMMSVGGGLSYSMHLWEKL